MRVVFIFPSSLIVTNPKPFLTVSCLNATPPRGQPLSYHHQILTNVPPQTVFLLTDADPSPPIHFWSTYIRSACDTLTVFRPPQNHRPHSAFPLTDVHPAVVRASSQISPFLHPRTCRPLLPWASWTVRLPECQIVFSCF